MRYNSTMKTEIPFSVALANPKVQVLTGQQWGFYSRLVIAQILGGVDSLPVENEAVAQLAGCATYIWMKARERVMKAIEATMPDIIEMYNYRMAINQRAEARARKAVLTRWFKKGTQIASKESANRLLSETNCDVNVVQPHLAAPHVSTRSNFTDQTAMKALKQRESIAGSLTEKPK